MNTSTDYITKSGKWTMASKLMATITACLVVGCGSGTGGGPTVPPPPPPPPPIPPPQVTMETLAEVTGRDSFLGEQGKGYAHVCPGAARGNEPRSFLIIVNGFSSESVDRQPAPGELESVCDNHDDTANFHRIESRWSTGADYIQRNAGFIRELIETINQKYEVNADDRLAIIGYSMGGLVSRYALQSMETEGVAHNIDLFVSVDSPQQGAYAPIGVQHIANVFRDDGAKPILDILNAPASRQMLIYHYSQGSNSQTWTDDYQTLFVDELQGVLGGFIRTEGLRTVAVSSGRIDGVLEQPAPGVLYFSSILVVSRNVSFGYNLDAGPCSTALRFDIDIDLLLWPKAWSLQMPSPSPNSLSKVASSDLTTLVNDIRLDNREALIDHFQADAKSQLSLICGIGATRAAVGLIVDIAIDEATEQANPFVKNYKDRIFEVSRSNLVSEGVPGGLSDHIGQLRSTMRDNDFFSVLFNPALENIETNVFIPVTSALMLTGVAPTDNLTVEMLEAASPFDKIYLEPTANLNHLESSTDWYAREVTALFDAP